MRGGRKPGARNKTTLAREALADEHGAAVLQFLSDTMNGVEVAGVRPSLGDRLSAARELRRAVIPPPRPAPVALDLPSGGDLRTGLAVVLEALRAGKLGVGEAVGLMQLL